MSFIRSSFMIFLVLIAHAVGMSGIYWLYRWFDAPVHFMGGVAAGTLALDIWRFGVKGMDLRRAWLRDWVFEFCFVLGITSLIGIAWELHEYLLDVWHDVGILRQSSIGDTMSDFVMDLLGGITAYVVFARTYRKN